MKDQFRLHPFFDWLKAQQRQSPPLPATVLAGASLSNAADRAVVPVWQVGDEWRYAYKDVSGSGTFVWTVDRIELQGQAQHYVVKSGRRELFYRSSDLALSMVRLDGVVVRTYSPALARYSWPLSTGRSLEQECQEERPVDRVTRHLSRTVTIEGEQTITVPAGTFNTVQVSVKNKKSGATILQYWYSPDTKQWIKDREFLRDGSVRDRELMAYVLGQPKKERTIRPTVTHDLAAVHERDDVDAVQRYREGARAGNGRAMADLGIMYFTGRGGLPKDDPEAVLWFRRGAEAGDALAMAYLGAGYWSGVGGLPREASEAVRWYRKGADAGGGRAMAMLGQVYLTGEGRLEASDLQAVAWFRRGVEAGDGRAMAMLGEMYLAGDGGLTQDEREAGRWFRKGADTGDGYAMALLGSMYELALGGLAKDDAAAMRWYQKGADLGNGRAMTGLGRMYMTGRGGLQRNETEAVRWFRAGAGVLDPVAMLELGQAYESGIGVAKNRDEAFRWYRKAAALGMAEAFDRLQLVEVEP
jgi:TPR repeat protein